MASISEPYKGWLPPASKVLPYGPIEHIRTLFYYDAIAMMAVAYAPEANIYFLTSCLSEDTIIEEAGDSTPQQIGFTFLFVPLSKTVLDSVLSSKLTLHHAMQRSINNEKWIIISESFDKDGSSVTADKVYEIPSSLAWEPGYRLPRMYR